MHPGHLLVQLLLQFPPASLAEAQTWAKVKFSLRGANLVEQDAAALLSHAFGTNVYVMTDVAKVLDAVQITKYPGMCSRLQFDLAVELQWSVNELTNFVETSFQ